GSALLASLAAAPLAAATRLPAAASTPFDPVYEALGRVLEFRAVAIAPDGSSLAWVEARELPGGPPSDDSAIFVQALVPGAKPRRLSARRNRRDYRERAPAFAPDGRSLAFLSNAGADHKPALWVVSLPNGKPRQLTHLDAAFDAPQWSPDGRTI